MDPPPVAPSPAARPTVPAQGRADWAAIGYDVLCPLCEYNLRGLPEPRCPECGYRFDWAEVLSPNRRPHEYLFEHHPERNWSRFWQTARGACRPKRFWTSLHPSQPSRPARLFLYWLIGAVLVGLVNPLYCVQEAALQAAAANRLRASQASVLYRNPSHRSNIVQFYGSTQAFLDRRYPTESTLSYLSKMFGAGQAPWRLLFLDFPLLLVVPALWSWLTAVAMMAFPISTRRGRLRRIHLVRCALYSFDPVMWAAFLLAGVFAGLFWAAVIGQQTFRYPMVSWGIWPIGLAILFGCWRLRAACAHYLRFSWPEATVLATQIIALLASLLVLWLIAPDLLMELYLALFRILALR